MVRRRPLALAAALALLALGGAWLVHRGSSGETDEERIRKLLLEAARAAEEGRPRDAVLPLSEHFSGGGLDRDGVRRLVALETLRGSWTSVTVAGMAVEVDGDRARAAFHLVAARGGAGRRLADLLPAEANAFRVACELERERAGFRVVRGRWAEVPLAEVLAGPPALHGAEGGPPPARVDAAAP